VNSLVNPFQLSQLSHRFWVPKTARFSPNSISPSFRTVQAVMDDPNCPRIVETVSTIQIDDPPISIFLFAPDDKSITHPGFCSLSLDRELRVWFVLPRRRRGQSIKVGPRCLSKKLRLPENQRMFSLATHKLEPNVYKHL
jgi:hypothetical protein